MAAIDWEVPGIIGIQSVAIACFLVLQCLIMFHFSYSNVMAAAAAAAAAQCGIIKAVWTHLNANSQRMFGPVLQHQLVRKSAFVRLFQC